MSIQAIHQYYNRLDHYKRFGGTRNESSIRRAFANLLEEYCLPKNLVLVDELHLKGSQKRPDGTVKDALQLDWGHWESKDSKDDIDVEIANKFAKGYPKDNIIFEDSETIVLIQRGEEVLRGDMQDAEVLDRILNAFVEYERPEISDFRVAIDKFREDIPDIVEALRAMIAEQAETNQKFQKARDEFWTLCKDSINLDITAFDIREMLIQHILTAEIFNTVFDEGYFHRENNIAKELDDVVRTFFTGAVRRNTLARIDNYYRAITTEAARIDNHHEKQKFLKVIYENFYKSYNPKGADKLGIVYTPNEIVKFLVESSDYLLQKHFGRSLSDKNVEILDPATGTGTFITDIIEHIPPQYLEYKYKNELHANELAILPYYIANLNIEYTYQQKMGEYLPFENIVFVDTLDNLGFGLKGKQELLFGGVSVENLERIKRQNDRKVSVIIGNPPYNASQRNENDNNKNRTYNEIDKRIKATYVKYSTAQKTNAYDMYSRFFRWASDRLNKDGVLAFITNRSFIDAKSFDGFRKSVRDEFDYIYIVDLGGDVRVNPNEAKSNVFGIMTGVAISFLVKKEEHSGDCRIVYTQPLVAENAQEKLRFLSGTRFQDITFENIEPDLRHNWLNITDNDFEELLQIASKHKNHHTVFKLFSAGVKSNRDEWVFDFSKENLEKKAIFFIDEYNHEVDRWIDYKNVNKIKETKQESSSVVDNFLHERNLIKWSKMIKRDKLRKHKKGSYNSTEIRSAFYRPFVRQYIYFSYIPIDLPGQQYEIFPDISSQNVLICVNVGKKPFNVLGTKLLPDYHYNGDSICFPLYYYDKKGNRTDNITDWGKQQFISHYQNSKITKEEIFYYTYGILHNPFYLKKYEINLKRELPRLPFYNNFFQWVTWGKTLMELHLDYEAIAPYSLRIQEESKPKDNPKTKLRAIPENGKIIIDENTSLLDIPAIAWEYKIGNRSALHWILDQYKEKKPRDPTIAEKFNVYKFAEYKDQVIDLLKRVCTISVKTVEIIHEMEACQETE